jgi:hypothetical protein
LGTGLSVAIKKSRSIDASVLISVGIYRLNGLHQIRPSGGLKQASLIKARSSTLIPCGDIVFNTRLRQN